MALFPRRNPILPPQALKLLSRLSMYIFGPALTFYSTSSHLNWERVKASLVLAAFSFFQNVLSLSSLWQGLKRRATKLLKTFWKKLKAAKTRDAFTLSQFRWELVE